MPGHLLESATPRKRLLFSFPHGLYSSSTEKLCAFLTRRIEDRSAIEIGAGHGGLAAALGTSPTENRQQEELELSPYCRSIANPRYRLGVLGQGPSTACRQRSRRLVEAAQDREPSRLSHLKACSLASNRSLAVRRTSVMTSTAPYRVRILRTGNGFSVRRDSNFKSPSAASRSAADGHLRTRR